MRGWSSNKMNKLGAFWLAIACCCFIIVAVCRAQLVSISSELDDSRSASPPFYDHIEEKPVSANVREKVTADKLNQCYASGLERARELLIAKYPVVNKRNLTDSPLSLSSVSGEAKAPSRDAAYFAALAEGMVRCLTSLYDLTMDEVRQLVSIELNHQSLLGRSCIVPEEVTIPMPDDASSFTTTPQDAIEEDPTEHTKRMARVVESMLDTTNPCSLYPYRTFTGYCNNPRHPEWGMSFRAFRRLLPADYDDGISSPRTTSRVTGRELPNSRRVSNAVHNTKRTTQHHIATHMVMQWGQLLDHDLTHTPTVTDARGKIAKCCGQTPPSRNPECFPVDVPEDDYFYLNGKKCLELVRSMPTTRAGCRLGPREQINQLTQYLDGSVIYGSTEAEANVLREFSDGLLRELRGQIDGVHGSGARLLPVDLFNQDCLNHYDKNNRDKECFRAGDLRVNEQTALSGIHLILIREHNRVAIALKQLNPHWQDERLFQEARKIVGAEMQQITYHEWLPLVVGPKIMDQFQLRVRSHGGYTNTYNSSVDATIANVFAAVAFRFGHTLIQGTFELFNSGNKLVSKLQLINMFNQPFHLYHKNTMDNMMKGLCTQRAQVFDRHIDNQVMDHLFEEPPGVEGKGQDLITRNIQRGRDHGIPPYVEWRRLCKLEVPKSFDHLREMNVMDPDAVNIMESLYDSVEDVDAFPAFMSELTLPDAVVGPTVGCVFGITFRHAKIGDRFWFENGINFPSVFSPEQLTALRKASLSRILCDNNDGGIRRLQPNVFLDPNTASYNNSIVSCRKIPTVDLTPWREDPNDKDAILTITSAMLRKPHTAQEDSQQILFTKNSAAGVVPGAIVIP